MQFLIKWWMQQVPMSQKVHKTVEAPRMWYMNTIVDMLEMKRTRFHSLNEWKEANDDLDAPFRTVCDMCSLYVSKSMCVAAR